MKKIHCNKCNALMGELRDARVRNDLVVYCGACNENLKNIQKAAYAKNDIPDFLKGMLRK